MGVRTHIPNYNKYVKKCKRNKEKPMDIIDFIMMEEE